MASEGVFRKGVFLATSFIEYKNLPKSMVSTKQVPDVTLHFGTYSEMPKHTSTKNTHLDIADKRSDDSRFHVACTLRSSVTSPDDHADQARNIPLRCPSGVRSLCPGACVGMSPCQMAESFEVHTQTASFCKPCGQRGSRSDEVYCERTQKRAGSPSKDAVDERCRTGT